MSPPRALAVVALATLVAAMGGASAQERGFSEEERVALDAGEIVVRARSATEGQLTLFGGTSFQAIDRTADEVWRAVHDITRFHEMLPETRSTTPVGELNGARLVRFEHAYGPIHAQYHLAMRWNEREREMRFALDDTHPNDLRRAHGFLDVRSYPHDRSRALVTWGILADMGGDGLVSSIFRPTVHDWMLRVPTTMRSFLMGRGRELYRAEDEAPLAE